MNDDPRNAQTLEEACKNPDGTFNGLRMLSWLSEALNPGHGISVDDVRLISAEVQMRGKNHD